jgi:signal transduction histidine kinase
MHQSVDDFGPPEKVFENDSKALRTIVRFDSRLIDSKITTKRQVFEELLNHIPELFEHLNYVAVMVVTEAGPEPYDFKILADGAKVRVSTRLTERAVKAAGAFLFRVREEGILETGHSETPLGEGSLLMPGGKADLDNTSGICVPIPTGRGVRHYLVFERQAELGLFLAEDTTLVSSIAARARDRIHNIELVRQNQMLNSNATLGVFAGMIGHDIKNYLFFGKKLSDVLDDPLSKHPGILKGIERSRKLAQSMKDLTAPGNVQMKRFPVRELADSVAREFASIFAQQCAFETEVLHDPGEITTSEDLLYRVVWNLVMNAYHTAENRQGVLRNPPWVCIGLDTERPDKVVIEIRDNAGGIGPRTLQYMQQSFALIRQVHSHEEDLIDVVNTINRMEGFTNSVGLFFTGVAVNDMDGEITVSTERGSGSTFRIVLPREIKGLKRLLRF